MSSIVSVRGAVKDYALGDVLVPALRGVDLEVNEGEFLSVAGPSGSGKTTLLNLIGCVDTATSGVVEVAGKDTGPALGAGAHRPAAQHHRLHLPELQPGLGAVGVAERRAPAPAAENAQRSPAARAGGAPPRPGGAQGLRRAPAERALGRPAAARGHRPRAGHRPQAGAGRRAHRQPRFGHRREHPLADARAQPHREDHLHLLDPRRQGDGPRHDHRAARRRQGRRAGINKAAGQLAEAVGAH
jgi:energy-coupling factor transporter ATP-binding protein EcfA2